MIRSKTHTLHVALQIVQQIPRCESRFSGNIEAVHCKRRRVALRLVVTTHGDHASVSSGGHGDDNARNRRLEQGFIVLETL
jgi:hypothetical protein